MPGRAASGCLRTGGARPCPTCPLDAARSTSTATCSPTRPSGCMRRSRPTTTDMIYAATRRRKSPRAGGRFIRKWRLKCKAVADSLEETGDRLFTFTRLPPSQWKSAADHQCDRTAPRGVQAPDQDPDGAAFGRDRSHVVLGVARRRSDHHAQSRRMADPRPKTRPINRLTSLPDPISFILRRPRHNQFQHRSRQHPRDARTVQNALPEIC